MKKTILIFVLLLILTFILRAPTFLRPFDLAYEYQLAFFGRQAFAGDGFYSSPWSMKGPGETFIYGLSYLLVGLQNWSLSVRIITALLAALATFIIYLAVKGLYGSYGGFLSALIFVLFFSRGGVFAGTLSYAEMLMPFFTVSGVFFFLEAQKTKSQKILFLAGLLFGFSLFFKQSAIYDFLPFFLYGMGKSFIKTKKIFGVFREYLFFLIGFLTPIGIFVSYIFLIGRFPRLWDWMVVKPSLYAQLREKEVLVYLKSIFKSSYPVWIIAYISMLFALLKKDRKRLIFGFWFLFTFFTFISSGKFWNYYFIQPFVPACFLAGAFFSDVLSFKKEILNRVFLFGILLVLIAINYPPYRSSFVKLFPLIEKKIPPEKYMFSLSEGEVWINQYHAASFLREKLKKEDKVFVLEGTPAIYILADRSLPYKDLLFELQFFENKGIGFAFNHSFQTIDGNRKTLIENLQTNPPDYLVIVMGSAEEVFDKLQNFPYFYAFTFLNYNYEANFGDVWIYAKKENILIPQKVLIEQNFYKKYFSQ